MQLRPAWPVDVIGGGCFISSRYEIAAGEQIIDLDTDVETMPGWGRLCVHPEGVRLMCTLLGWNIDNEAPAKIAERDRTIEALRAENDELRDALRGIVESADLLGVTQLVRKGAT